MTQGKLFSEFPALDALRSAQPTPLPARKSDPASSKAAAREITRSGEADLQRAEVISLVVEHPGRTSLELTRFTYLDRYQIARRLPEAERMGIVKKGEIRKCAVGKRPAVTWWPDGQ